jgi:hypothetical protein
MEDPLDLSRPILSQRRFARFFSGECKTLLSRVPLRWAPGCHSIDRAPNFDQRLFLFHTKLMDFYIAYNRHSKNRQTAWSEESLRLNQGAHHRYSSEQFVRRGFLDPVNTAAADKIGKFNFDEEIERLTNGIVEQGGFYHTPMDIWKTVEIPDYFRSAF